MRVNLTGDELNGIADRLALRLEPSLKAVAKKAAPPLPVPTGAEFQLDQIRRDLAHDLAPILCVDDAPLTAEQARALMGIKKSKWHMLRKERRIPEPEPTICGDRWLRSSILECMRQVGVDAEG